MKVSEYIADFLIAKDITTVFSVTGGASAELNDSFLLSKELNLIYAHNEASCSYMAEGYYRRTGKVAACLVTVGPGATNLLTGIYGCWVESVPTVVISGQSFLNQTVGTSELRQLGTQEADIIKVVRSFTKFSTMVTSAAEVSDVLEIAWKTMMAPRKGPVWLDIPADIQRSELPNSPYSTSDSLQKAPKEISVYENSGSVVEFVGQIVAEISKAKRPILHIGNGARDYSLNSDFIQLVNELKLPLLLTHNSYDMLPTSHDLNFGFPGIFGHRYANILVQNCDLYIGVGTRLTLAQTGYTEKAFARKAITFLVDIDQNELNKKHLRLDKVLCHDAADFLEQLQLQMQVLESNKNQPVHQSWVSFASDLRNKFDVLKEHQDFKTASVSPYRFIRELSAFLEPGDAVLTDMGTSYQSTYQAIQIPDRCSLQTNTGFAAMGWGLPAAIGSTYATKVGKTICVTGDGGLMMSVQELASIPKESLLYIFVYNNEGYLTQRQTQESTFGRITGSDTKSGLSFPDYERLAAAFSLNYALIKDEANMHRELDEIFSSRTPILVEVKMTLDQIQAPKLVNRKDLAGRNIQSQLEDMWPFLEETEWREISGILDSMT